MTLTTDPNDPRLNRGEPQHEAYLVLSEEELAKGFVRPVRHTYIHEGPVGPKYPLCDLTPEQEERYQGQSYAKFEPYPESERPQLGRYWTQAQLDGVGKGCGVATRMDTALAETYARQPGFYGRTFCVGCQEHLPVGEFVWEDGTRVGS